MIPEGRLAKHFFEDEIEEKEFPGSLHALLGLSEVAYVSTSSFSGSAWKNFIGYAETE